MKPIVGSGKIVQMPNGLIYSEVRMVADGEDYDAPVKRLYTTHEVAVIIAELFGDDCACNFNGIDEWLPCKCELLDACPHPVGVACWEQYLKHRGEKNDD